MDNLLALVAAELHRAHDIEDAIDLALWKVKCILMDRLSDQIPAGDHPALYTSNDARLAELTADIRW